LYIIKTYKWT